MKRLDPYRKLLLILPIVSFIALLFSPYEEHLAVAALLNFCWNMASHYLV